jgi:hypothetical protein
LFLTLRQQPVSVSTTPQLKPSGLSTREKRLVSDIVADLKDRIPNLKKRIRPQSEAAPSKPSKKVLKPSKWKLYAQYQVVLLDQQALLPFEHVII